MVRRIFVLVLLLSFALAATASAATAIASTAVASSEDELVAAGFVEPSKVDPTIILDIRYATTNNFTGQQVYPSARCYLRADIARRVVAAQADLRKRGLGLKLYDCYRPFSVQEVFWRLMPDETYVLRPVRKNGVIVKSSKHNRGAAVDLTLVDKDGRELPMPTAFDDFTEKAHRGNASASPEARRNSLVLERAMQAQGFEPYPSEWWHFDGPGWQNYAPLDTPFPASQ